MVHGMFPVDSRAKLSSNCVLAKIHLNNSLRMYSSDTQQEEHCRMITINSSGSGAECDHVSALQQHLCVLKELAFHSRNCFSLK